MIKAVFIDMDDTLIVNNVLYEHAKAMLTGYMRHFGVTAKELDKVFAKAEADNFKTHGLSRERYPASFEATLRHFIPDADDELVENVRGFAKTVFETVASLKPGVVEALDLLAAHYPVYLVTQGDATVQKTRISHLPFKDDFKDVMIVEKKAPGTYLEIVKKLGLSPEEAVMIGDSLKSDIIASTAAGLKAIWIENHERLSIDTEQSHLPAGALKFPSVLEAARHLLQNGFAPIPAPKVRRQEPKM